MQACDVFFLKTDICQLGTDQRKVNMLAHEYAKKKKITKPCVIGSIMIPGLKKGQFKASKSDPSSAIFMEDTPMEVATKIKSAHGPVGTVDIDENPLLSFAKYFVFSYFKEFKIERPEKFGGEKITYTDFELFK